MAFASSLEEDDLKGLIEPKLKLFLSIDIVGSTAFKQENPRNHATEGQAPGGPTNWLSFLTSFYREFGSRLKDNIVRCLEDDGRNGADVDASVGVPMLWKALGDELIYVITLKHEAHLSPLLNGFRHALSETIDRATTGEQRLPLSMKGAAWLAGFPVCNAEIPLVSDAADSNHVTGFDYAGPTIDIGFRISKFATPQRLVVSAEVAYLLARTGGTMLPYLHPDRPTILKGVLKESEYPLFWINTQEGLRRAWKPELLRGKEPVQLESERLEQSQSQRAVLHPPLRTADLPAYLSEWFNGHPVLVRPFIRGGHSACDEPPGYNELLLNIQAQLREQYRPSSPGTSAGTEDTEVADGADASLIREVDDIR